MDEAVRAVRELARHHAEGTGVIDLGEGQRGASTNAVVKGQLRSEIEGREHVAVHSNDRFLGVRTEVAGRLRSKTYGPCRVER